MCTQTAVVLLSESLIRNCLRAKSIWQPFSVINFSPINSWGYNWSTTINSSEVACGPIFTSARIIPSKGITFPIGPKRLWSYGRIGFPISEARLRLIKLLLAPVSTIAQQSRFCTWTGTYNPLPLTISPEATASDSLSLHLLSVHFTSKKSGSFLLKIFTVWGSASRVIGTSSRGCSLMNVRGGSCGIWGSFWGKKPPGPTSLHISFQVWGSTYRDLLRRPYRFLLLRDRSLLGGGFGVAALGANVFSAEAEPATVATPAVPSLTVPT